MALTNAERQARYRARQKAGESRLRYRLLAATVNFPFVATENCTPCWLAGSAPRSKLLTSSTGKERGSDARMGDEDVAEALPGPGRASTCSNGRASRSACAR